MTTSTDRQTFRETVALVAAKAKAKLPQAVNGRVEKAVALVLAGDVEPQPDGSVVVSSLRDPSRRYVLQGHACTCADFERGQAPDGWCAHRLARAIFVRAQALAPDREAAAPPLPEAPASVNVRLTIDGREVQLTLRDTDETRLLVRLEDVLQRYPQPQAPPARQDQGQGWCAIHNTAMQANHKNGRAWFSHKTDQGWCQGKGGRP